MSCFITYFAHPKSPYLTVSEEGQEESTIVFVRKDEDGTLTVEGLPEIEENSHGWEEVRVSRNGVEYIHNRSPFTAEFEGFNPATHIASRVSLRRVASSAVHLPIKRRPAAQPAGTL